MNVPRLFTPFAAATLLACPAMADDPPVGAPAAGLAEENDPAREAANAAEQIRKREQLSQAVQAFNRANATGEIAAMEKALEEIRKLDPDGGRTALPEIQLALARKDWPAVSAQLGALIDGPMSMVPIQTVARTLANRDDAPKELLGKAIEGLQPWAEKLGSPTDYQTLATLQWKAGEKEAAVTSAKKAATAAREERYVAAGYPAVAYDKLAAALEAGDMPARETINRWFGEESAKLREARANE